MAQESVSDCDSGHRLPTAVPPLALSDADHELLARPLNMDAAPHI